MSWMGGEGDQSKLLPNETHRILRLRDVLSRGGGSPSTQPFPELHNLRDTQLGAALMLSLSESPCSEVSGGAGKGRFPPLLKLLFFPPFPAPTLFLSPFLLPFPPPPAPAPHSCLENWPGAKRWQMAHGYYSCFARVPVPAPAI